MNDRQNDVIRQVMRALDEDGEYSWFDMDDLIYDHGGAILGADERLEVKGYILAHIVRP